MTSTSVASPCIDVCRIDARTGLCEGCLRTLDAVSYTHLTLPTNREV